MREALVSAVHTSSFEEEEAHLNGVVPQLVKKRGDVHYPSLRLISSAGRASPLFRYRLISSSSR